MGWLDQPAGLRWLDVGCGTGALTTAVLAQAEPDAVVGVDPSEGFVGFARGAVTDERARFEVLSAGELNAEAVGGAVDVVVAGLALNFIPERVDALRRMRDLG
ncbi:MAG: hypothetical protein QOH03_3915, partial [Kribbellaceae bacterium]|nr:hypothetical protein [Kribbellaceae bacterium]